MTNYENYELINYFTINKIKNLLIKKYLKIFYYKIK